MRWTPEEYAEYLAKRNKAGSARTAPIAESKPAMTMKPSTDVLKLNKTERAYFEHLKMLNYVWIGVQHITLKLADDCRLTPDFATVDERGNMRLIDVKGFQREDALIKMKVAARMFPWAEFVIVKRDGTGWDHQEVKP